MCVRDSYVYQKGVLCCLIHESYVRSVGRYCFVRNYAAIPVQLEVVILQHVGWCVFVVWTFACNQFSCFCQFLVDNFSYAVMSFYILSRCLLLTCCRNVLDCLRFFSTSSAQLINVCLLQNVFHVVSC